MRFTWLLCMSAVALTPPKPPPFEVQGHRGCRGLMPENTIPAFLKALDLGVTTLELDVVISADGQVVVSHEPYFSAAYSRKPDGTPVRKSEQKTLNLYRMPYADIRRYDVGSGGNPAFPEQEKRPAYKPLLSEVIEAAEAHRTARNGPVFTYNIEIKSEPTAYNQSQPEPAAFCDRVADLIRPRLPPDRVTIQSFDFAVLQHWHQRASAGQYPAVKLAALVERPGRPEQYVAKLGFKPAIYSPHYRLLSRSQIDRLHALRIRVIPWTVNQRKDMERLRQWGVDGIITDYPNRSNGL